MRRTCVLAVGLLACGPAPEVATARLLLRALPSCELAPAEQVTVRASGDFPSELRQVDLAAPDALDGFPPDTRWLAIESSAGGERAGSLIARGSGDQLANALMLPLGRSCPLGDPLAAAPPGAALAPLPGGGLLIAGGRPSGGSAATAQVAVLPPGAALARAVPQGMLLRRAGASATPLGERVVIAGGGADERGPAHDSFEVYEQARDAFDLAQSANLSGPRRDHGAARLPDGRVLLAGGVTEVGAQPLASAELIELGAGDSSALERGLRSARTSPHVLVLDDGSVLIALGLDARGEPVTEVERFDPEQLSFVHAGQLPAHPQAAVVALEGGLIAYVGCSPPDVLAATCELVWLLPDGERWVAAPAALEPAALASAGLNGLLDLRAVALGDGRLLVTGRDLWDDVERRAFVIDPNVPAIERADASRVPDGLITLADGAIVEIDAAGASLRRHDVQSELDDPPDPLRLGPDAFSVVLDAAERWSSQEDGLVAVSDARIDLPRLRFAALRVELELDGEARLLLEPDAAPAVAIEIDPDRLSLGECSLERGATRAVAIERDGERVTLESDGRTRGCSAARPLGDRVGIALRAVANTHLRALRVVRR